MSDHSMASVSGIKKTTCPYCGVGCGVDAKVEDGNIIAVSGSRDHSANYGRLCVKGTALHETNGLAGRLLYPKIQGKRASWEDAIAAVADGFTRIIEEHGPGAVAFYLSGQLLTEDYYVANKLMKGFIGSGNVDTNSRLCMAAAAAGYKRAFGEDAVPGCYEDLELCDLLVLVGSNAAWTHPVAYQRIQAAKERRPEMKVVVVDPRKTATCDIADLHLAIKPGSDAFLYVGLLHYLASHDTLNMDYIRQHTRGFDDALAVARETNLESLAEVVGIETRQLERFYRWFAETEKSVTLYSQGINQSSTGTDKGNAIINCHLATGRIGREGMGPFSITGQPNAMGGREVGGLATQLAAHMDFTAEHIDRVGRFWGSSRVATGEGLKAVDLFEAIHRGEVKAVWIMATNPVVSLPNADRVREALEKCELTVVSDCVELTDTTACADVLLPATGWGEKDGMVTNSERTISRQRALVPPPGEARHDWQIVSAVAAKMGFGEAFKYRSPRDVFCEHAALSGFENNGDRALDISGLADLSEKQYNEMTPLQWPVNAVNKSGKARLFETGTFSTTSGKANFIAVEPRLPPQEASAEFPYILNSGRIRDQWHTMTRTARAPRLLNHVDGPYLSIHPGDARQAGIETGDIVLVQSQYGQIELLADVNSSVKKGEVFAPIHWNDQYASSARVGALVAPVTDISGQPESKFSPVAVQKIAVSRWMVLASNSDLDVSGFDFWLKIPIKGGFRYHLACREGDDFDPVAWLKDSLPPVCSQVVFEDAAREDYRILCRQQGRVVFAAFAGCRRDELPEGSWLSGILSHGEQSDWTLLSGRARQGADKGRLICSCFEVGENEIRREIRNGAATAKMLGERLCCGTNCGSCVPELKTMISETPVSDADQISVA